MVTALVAAPLSRLVVVALLFLLAAGGPPPAAADDLAPAAWLPVVYAPACDGVWSWWVDEGRWLCLPLKH